jgi:hypothetical protein
VKSKVSKKSQKKHRRTGGGAKKTRRRRRAASRRRSRPCSPKLLGPTLPHPPRTARFQRSRAGPCAGRASSSTRDEEGRAGGAGARTGGDGARRGVSVSTPKLPRGSLPRARAAAADAIRCRMGPRPRVGLDQQGKSERLRARESGGTRGAVAERGRRTHLVRARVCVRRCCAVNDPSHEGARGGGGQLLHRKRERKSRFV